MIIPKSNHKGRTQTCYSKSPILNYMVLYMIKLFISVGCTTQISIENCQFLDECLKRKPIILTPHFYFIFLHSCFKSEGDTSYS